jgi:prepilin-type N-terminal cleavage/methylation domain-containing protein
MILSAPCHCEERRDEAISIRNPKSPGGRHSGVTLTEVIVASALLALAIAPLLKALTAAQVEDRAIERKSWSLLLAQQELEGIRARCLHHYDTCYRVDSQAIRDGYLCSVADDAHPSLRTVTVSVGLDQDNNGVLSADEVEVSLSTRLAR